MIQHACKKISTVSIAFSSDFTFFKARVTSSACCKFFTSVEVLLSWMPLIYLLFFSFKDNISATNKYNKAEIGQTCLIPLDIEQVFETQPLFLILKIGFVYNIFTQVIKLSPQLKDYSQKLWKSALSQKFVIFYGIVGHNICFLK